MSAANWTEDRFENAKRLWLEGKSAGEIMRVLRREGVRDWPSRNAVIGRLQRAGLTDASRPHLDVPKPKSPKRTKPIFIVLGRLHEGKRGKPLPPEPPPSGPVVPIMSLASHHCRWPIGEPSQEGFGFCGARKASIGSYCPHHQAVSRGQGHGAWKSTSELIRSVRHLVR